MIIKDYFDIKELVCKHVYSQFKEQSWQFLDPKLLETIFAIRKNLNKPMIINTWSSGGKFSQRGLRCNICDLVKSKTLSNRLYLSAHMQGTAVDFDVQGMSAEEVRKWIERNKVLLPYPIRLEEGVNWVHLDMRNDGSKGRVTYFKG